MTTIVKDYFRQLDALKAWLKGFENNSGGNPLINELQNRFSEIEILLAEDVTEAENDPGSKPISMNEMRIIFNLNRCEAIRELINNESIRPDRNIINRSLYPNFFTIYVQKLICCIMGLKKRLKLEYNDYTVFSIWQLSYIRYPAILTKFLSRFSAYIRASYRQH